MLDQTDVYAASYVRSTTNNPAHEQAYLFGPNTNPDAGRYDIFLFQYWYLSTAPTLPLTRQLAPSNWAMCDICPQFYEGCDSNFSNCTRAYLGQSGSVTINAMTRSTSNGFFNSNGSQILMQEWDFTSDDAGTSGRCVQVNTYSFDAGWCDGGPC